eukprot:1507886-Alexandrium_andersonii.AAC.1
MTCKSVRRPRHCGRVAQGQGQPPLHRGSLGPPQGCPQTSAALWGGSTLTERVGVLLKTTRGCCRKAAVLLHAC